VVDEIGVCACQCLPGLRRSLLLSGRAAPASESSLSWGFWCFIYFREALSEKIDAKGDVRRTGMFKTEKLIQIGKNLGDQRNA
jgi:hypothetical protein